MSSEYHAYAEYKKTQLGWLSQIPSHWEVMRLKYLGDALIGLTYSPGEVVDDGEGILVLRSSNVQNRQLAFDDNVYVNKKIPEKLITKKGDILICARNGSRTLIGKNAQIDESAAGISFGAFMSIFRSPHNDYLSKVFNSPLFEYQSGSFLTATINQLTTGNLNSFKIPLPAEAEREKIASFLDYETAKIDTLIEKYHQLIKLLKEKCQAVISHAVTKGLNPDAPMRDSGVEWLGEVPEHWEVSNMDYALNAIGDVDHYMPKSVEKGIPYVMTGDLKELASSINFKDCKQVNHNNYLKLSKKIKSSRGDVIMARYATIGTVSYIDIDADFLVSYSCVTIKPNLSKAVGLYLFYYFKSDAFLQGIQSQVNTNTQGNVGVNDLKKIKVALPPLAEQSKLIEYLQSKISKLDSISDRSQAAIALAQERRTALISAAVTGKIDVRNWVAPAHSCSRDISASMHVTAAESSKPNNEEVSV